MVGGGFGVATGGPGRGSGKRTKICSDPIVRGTGGGSSERCCRQNQLTKRLREPAPAAAARGSPCHHAKPGPVAQALTDNLRQTIRKLTQRPRFVRKLTHRPSGGGRWVSSRWHLFNHCRRGLTHPGSPSKRRPDTSARPGHDWTHTPAKRTTTRYRHPLKTTTTEHRHELQRPRRPRERPRKLMLPRSKAFE